MNAREYLEQIEYLDKLINNKLSELYQLRCLAVSCTAPTDREASGSSGVSDRVGKIVSKIVDLQAEYHEIVDRFIDEKTDRIKVIEGIKKPLYYTILHRHYIGVKYAEDSPTWYMSLQDIAETEGYSYSHICDCQLKALAEVQRVLDER